MTKQLSRHAEAAKLIRNHLKAQGIAGRVRSEPSCINVYVTDLEPSIAKPLNDYVRGFQYGHFDGMTDCYDYSNRRDDIPQVKFAFFNNEMSDKMRETIYQHIRATWSGGDELPATYAEGYSKAFHGQWVSDFVYRAFRDESSTFWQETKLAA